MPAPDDDARESSPPTQAAEFDQAANIPDMHTLSPRASNNPALKTTVMSPSNHSQHPPRRRRARLRTALRLSASGAYQIAAPHTAATYLYTLSPPTLALSASTLANPLLPLHSATALDSFTFDHLSPALDSARSLFRAVLAPLLAALVDGAGAGAGAGEGRGRAGCRASVVVVCYGEDAKAKADLLVGREGGAGVLVQTTGALLQAITERENGQKTNAQQKAQTEEKREAEDDQQPQPAPPTPTRRRKHRLTLSALRLTHSALTDLLSPNTPVTLSALSATAPTVEVLGWTEHRVREAKDCVRLLLRAERQLGRLESGVGGGGCGDEGESEVGHVVYRVGVESRWRRDGGVRDGGDDGGNAKDGSGDGYRYSSLTFVKLAVAHGSSASAASQSSTSSTQPFSPHWINKDTLALTRVLSCLLNPPNSTQHPASSPAAVPTAAAASAQHVPYRSSLLTSTLSTALEHCSELVLLFGLRDQTGGGSGGWTDGREDWRFVEGLPDGVGRGKRERVEDSRRKRGWRGAEDERDSDDEEEERVLTVLEYFKAESAKRAAALQPSASAASPPRSPRSASPPLQTSAPRPQPSRPATPPPTADLAPAAEQKEQQQPSPPAEDELSAAAAAAEAAKREKEAQAAAALQRRQEKEADNRAAILHARQQQQQRDLDRELRTLQPLLTALGLPAPPTKPTTPQQLATLRSQVDQSLRQRVCGGMGVWKWSKKRVGGEVRRRECEVRWDGEVGVEGGGGVCWEGRKRWRRVVKTVAGGDVERLVVGGGVDGGVLEEWKARMRALAEQKKGTDGGDGGLSAAERAEMKRQFRAIDRWSISVVSGSRVLDMVCDSEECHVVLLEGLKRLLGGAVKVEDRRPGNGGMKVRDVKA